MSFVFQQPGTSPLLDAIEDFAADCEVLGGMFAFATKAGVELFLDLPEVQALLARGGRVNLTVGLDAITNGEALLYLDERIAQTGGGLEVRAYLHPWPGTFHPKYMWFVQGDRVTIIAGSGNLTPSGLGCLSADRPNGNWEAFLVQQLDPTNSKHFLDSIRQWIARAANSGFLLKVDHPRVLARGAANSRVKFVRPPRERNGDEGNERNDADAPAALPPLPPIIAWPLPPGAATARVRRKPSAAVAAAPPAAPPPRPTRVTEANDGPDAFVREISRNRPGQADVGQEGLRFFGYRGDAASTVLLQFVGLDNGVEQPIEKHLFVNASKNRRVEMGQIAQHDYDVGRNDERMILVAVRLDERTFRYTIVPVTHRSYRKLSAFLDTRSVPRAGRMREAFVDSNDLVQAWVRGPRNLFPVTMVSTEA